MVIDYGKRQGKPSGKPYGKPCGPFKKSDSTKQ